MPVATAKRAPTAVPRPKAAQRIAHPAVPLTEVEIFQTASHKLIGFPDAAPLKRAACNDLDQARLSTIRNLLAASPGASAALKDYAIAHGHVEAGADKADLAAVLADLWKSGLIIARGLAFKGVTASPLTLSDAGERFLLGRETQAGVSEKLHHPTSASGVTLGAGYDMKDRSASEIISTLTNLGVERKSATTVSGATGLFGSKADDFVALHADAVTLTDAQQSSLFDKVLPPFVVLTKRGLVPSIQQRLFDYEFDALVSFTYNLGHLAGTHLAKGINAGNLAQVNFFRRGPGQARISAERSMFTAGIYL